MKFIAKLKNGKEIDIFAKTKVNAIKNLEEYHGKNTVESIKKTEGRLK